MKIAGIIAEYNPFHNGHLWQLEATRQAGATHIVAVMGGNWLQRGAPALCEKHVRARAALLSGVDLVLELPLPYACATAQRFAYGGVGLLAGLGCVELLSFGSEAGELGLLSACARAAEDPGVRELIRRQLDRGMTFAAARQSAIREGFGEEVAAPFSSPNNILAIEYLRQLDLLGGGILPFTVPRAGAGHDSSQPSPQAPRMASASYVRGLFEAGQGDKALTFMPREAHRTVTQGLAQGLGALPQRLELPMLAKLRGMSDRDFAMVPDISEGLEHRLACAVRCGTGMEEILDLVKTKRYTRARLRRILLAAFLGIPGGMDQEPPPYLRVLGMNPRGAEILAQAKKTARLPLSHSLAQLEKTSPRAAAFAALESRSTDLYTLATPAVLPCGLDYTSSIIKTDN